MQHVGEYHGARPKQWVPLWDQLSASKWASRHQPTCSKENTSSSSQRGPSAQNELGRRNLPPWFACVYEVWACQPILPTTAHVSFKTTYKTFKESVSLDLLPLEKCLFFLFFFVTFFSMGYSASTSGTWVTKCEHLLPVPPSAVLLTPFHLSRLLWLVPFKRSCREMMG